MSKCLSCEKELSLVSSKMSVTNLGREVIGLSCSHCGAFYGFLDNTPIENMLEIIQKNNTLINSAVANDKQPSKEERIKELMYNNEK